MNRVRVIGAALITLPLLCGDVSRADDAKDAAVHYFEKLGCKVVRDDKADGKPVVGMNPEFTALQDKDLIQLAQLKKLQSLHFNQTRNGWAWRR